MLGLGIGVGLVTTLGSINLLGKATNSKWHVNLLFIFSLLVFLLVITQEMETETKLVNLVLLLLVLPLCFAGSQSGKAMFTLVIIDMLLTFGSLLAFWWADQLESEYLENTLDLLDKAIQVITQGLCSYLLAYGYSFIPELLITPALNHTFKKANLESQQYTIERAKSNIYFHYSCRGLPTPKHEQNNLKFIEREAETIQYKLDKLSKNNIANSCMQVLSVSSGLFLLICGFWLISLLTGVLVEDLVISKCGILCGFDARSRIAKWVGYYDFCYIVSGVFYLACCLLGYVWKFENDIKEVSSDVVMRFVFITVSCGFSIRTVYSFFDEDKFPVAFRLAQFAMHGAMIVGTSFLFIYWHFFKCKNR